MIISENDPCGLHDRGRHDLFLKVLDGPHAGRIFDCSRGPLLIGRRMPPSSVLTLDEDVVSRGAVRIEHQDDGFMVSDNSENGITVNDSFVHGQSVTVKPGDTIQVGKTRLILLAACPETGPFPVVNVELDQAKVEQVLRLFPGMEVAGLMEFLLNRELDRRGQPDRITGAGTLQGLMYAVPRVPRGRHFTRECRGMEGSVERWMIAADVRGLNQVNDQAGMAAGDEVLMILARVLGTHVPEAYVYRLHGDALVAICDKPLEFESIAVTLNERFREALHSAMCETLRSMQVELVFALLHLVIEQPFSPDVLGPLFRDEIERALLLARLPGQKPEVLHRTLRLDGFVSV